MDKLKTLTKNIPKLLKNKYTITLVLFLFWILLIDDYNLLKQHKLQKDIKELKEQKEYYLYEIEKDSTELYHLQNTKEEQERFARERFLMKKKNEDVFIIRKKNDE